MDEEKKEEEEVEGDGRSEEREMFIVRERKGCVESCFLLHLRVIKPAHMPD